MVKRNAADGRVQFTTDVVAAVHHGTLQFIGVGTPPEVQPISSTCWLPRAASAST